MVDTFKITEKLKGGLQAITRVLGKINTSIDTTKAGIIAFNVVFGLLEGVVKGALSIMFAFFTIPLKAVPFFKKECTLIFEAQFCKLYAHVHITIKSENYVDVFSELTSWKNRVFPNDS